MKIYELMDQRERALGNKNPPLSIHVKKIEQILDDGYYFEYREDIGSAPGINADGSPAEPPEPQTFSEKFKEKFKVFFQKKIEEIKKNEEMKNARLLPQKQTAQI